MSSRCLQFNKQMVTIACIALLKGYGFLSRPFGYRWFGWVGVFVSRYADPNELCRLKLSEDSIFSFYLADYYWSKLAYAGFSYEPEIEQVLKLISSVDYLFLDLGANHGYWSVLASSKALGSKNTVAIEPVKRNFERLSAHNRLNHNRFTAIRSAVTQSGGSSVNIYTADDSFANEGASMIKQTFSNSAQFECVESVSIDQLVNQFSNPGQGIVVKLDVEGMEVEAIKGAKESLNRELLLIYEDHGNDPQCEVSAYVLGLGLTVFHLEHGIFSEVNNIDDVKTIKTRANKGYNLFAFNQSPRFSKVFKSQFPQ